MNLLEQLTPEEREAAEAEVARVVGQMRAERDVAEADARGRAAAGLVEHLDVNAQTIAWGEVEDPADALIADQERADEEDFLAFWAAQDRRVKVLRNVVPGVDLAAPAEMPLSFEITSRKLANDRSLAAVHTMFGMLYGDGKLAELIAGGLTGRQLSVLLLWGAANGNGREMNLAEAKAEFERLNALQAAGKALGPSASGATSSSTGPSSKPTSRGSTRRRKKKSRR